ncbi:acyl-CoA dehydrogenase family protein [Arcticibacterium luteifluviistationis]|uniref:acyl-CoA oxidase n=1 Tax=Arcticibacterium luteifluviistationis TaxID=1784714 RepID=A0A2Z4GIE6_9BACT|nr:acyl-CoA dehydrogenase [Arcticibacterium luteifluviistationis]AWW00614.1 acyl-CoA oxidase [Arcticibacterium luteifluviistationis]
MHYSPGINSLLPLFYVGWADSVLSPSEMKIIRQHVDAMDFLSFADKKQLIKWTDQSNPPSEETYKEWLADIHAGAMKLDLDKKLSLVQLGINIAKNTSKSDDNQIWDSPKVKASIEGLEMALGVDNQLSKVAFYTTIKPEDDTQIEDIAGFDTKKIQAILDGKFAEHKNRTKKLIMDPFFEIPYDLREKDALRNLILKQCKELGKQGFGALAFPEEYGGENSPGASTAVFETMALGNISLLIKFGVQFGLFGGAVLQLGTKKHHDKYLTETGSLGLAGCFAMTETGHGSNVRDLETTATYNPEDQTITIHSPTHTAGKEYIGNALHSKMAAVFTQLKVGEQNHGIHAILVPLRDEKHQELPGITVKDNGYKMGLNGVDNGRIWFDQVKVPVENLLDKYGGIDAEGNYQSSIKKESKRFFTMLGALVGGRVSVALGSNTAAKKALDIAIKYALKRRQFDSLNETTETLILDYPSHQKRLFPLVAKSYALSFALESLRDKFIEQYNHTDKREVETLAAGLKSYASWHATATIQECREACGGKGYLAENEFADLKADTDIFTTFEGDNHVLLQLVAKALLTDFKQEFNDGGFMAVARHVMKRVGTSVTDLNPITVRNTNAEHILSYDFLDSAFEFRQQKLLFTLSDRMRNFLKKKLHPSEIFLRVQNHMITLALAQVEQYIYKEFKAKVRAMPKDAEKDALETMLKTYSLDAILRDNGWFLENDFLTGEKSKAIRRVQNSLYRKIRPLAASYVDAFGIPKVLRRAEIVKEV